MEPARGLAAHLPEQHEAAQAPASQQASSQQPSQEQQVQSSHEQPFVPQQQLPSWQQAHEHVHAPPQQQQHSPNEEAEGAAARPIRPTANEASMVNMVFPFGRTSARLKYESNERNEMGIAGRQRVGAAKIAGRSSVKRPRSRSCDQFSQTQSTARGDARASVFTPGVALTDLETTCLQLGAQSGSACGARSSWVRRSSVARRSSVSGVWRGW